MSILKRKSKNGFTYLARVFISEDYSTGKQKMTSKSFTSYKEAKAWKAQMEAARTTGTLVVPKVLTLAQYSQEWLKTTARDSLKVQTVELYESVFKNHILPALGGRQLQKLTVREVKKLLKDLQDKKASRSTMRNVHSALRSCLREALVEELVLRNVASVAQLPNEETKLQGEEELSSPTPSRKAKVKALTRDEARVFIRACLAHPLGLVLLFAIVTGARPGEYLAARWSDIDWEGYTVTFERSLVRPKGGGWKVNTPKTKRSVRTVSLPEHMLALLAEHKAKQDKVRQLLGEHWLSKVDFIFTTSHGAPLDTRRLNTKVFRQIVKDAGLPEDLTLYSLRHSCASILFAEGVQVKVASDRLGHSSTSLTQDVYIHVTSEAAKSAGEEIGRVLFSRP